VDRNAIERTTEQVRAILEAAESSAAEMRADAAGQVARVEEAATRLRARIDELGALLDSMAVELTAGIARLREEAGAAPVEEDFAGAAPATIDEPGATEIASEPAADDVEPGPAADEAEPGPAADEVGPGPAAPNGDEAGARLIALNMALAGKPREEAARYLAERFRLANVEALLDDVYARAGR
jgi:hypothetical protein